MAVAYTAFPGGTGSAPGKITSTELAVFIPELWSDEIIATHKANLVAQPLVSVMDHVGKKGDTINIPTPARAVATAKAEYSPVNVISNTETDRNYTINKHFEYSRLIEDFAKVQAIDTYRAFYTDDAGYAMSKLVDTHILREGAGFGDSTWEQWADETNPDYWAAAYIGGDGSTLWDRTDSTNAGNASKLTDAAIRTSIQRLDDTDTPSARRVLVVPPVEKSNILGGAMGGDANYSTYNSVGEAGGANQLRNGLIANIYGVPVYVSTNCPVVTDAGAGVDQRAVLLFQREALVLFEQLRLRTQTQYKQEFLAELFTADMIFDTGVLRPESGVALIVPA